MQRTPKYIDTRPHLTASHHTTNLKRLAASGVLEQTTNQPSGNLVLNGPTTRGVLSPYKGTHSVQDAALYQEYTAGQAYAQYRMPANRKAPQIQAVCYSADVMPDINDRLAADPQLAAVQSAKNTYARGWNTASCCAVCGEPAQFTTACPCNASGAGLKDVTRRFTTPS